MSLQEWAVAIGLLTPLILGVLAFIEKFLNRKKGDEPKEDEPEVLKGMTVAPDYAGDYIKELKADRAAAEAEVHKLKIENDLLRAQLKERK